MPDFSTRDNTREILDDFTLSGEALVRNLDEIEFINRRLGGNKLVIDGMDKITMEMGQLPKTLRIADIGCGSGDVLRALSTWGKKKGIELELHGFDANPNILDYATTKANGHHGIHFHQLDILEEELTEVYDIVLMNLFLHHFEEDDIRTIMDKLRGKTSYAILVNDLHRHPMAYYSFKIMCRLMGFSELSLNDGSLSVLKAFTNKDLAAIIRQNKFSHYTLEWKWAFRFQAILYNN